LDLDETLVHSSFKPTSNPDFVVEVEIEGKHVPVYVQKRPGVDEFLKRCGELFEVVVFTASISSYASAVVDRLDKYKVVSSRLAREDCSYYEGYYLKDLSKLGRNLSQVVIIDNSPISYSRQPYNAMAISTWFDDPLDQNLARLIPWLEKVASAKDVYDALEECRAATGYSL
jgi:RNA polymerase II subunit A small phosphatase-like protein